MQSSQSVEDSDDLELVEYCKEVKIARYEDLAAQSPAQACNLRGEMVPVVAHSAVPNGFLRTLPKLMCMAQRRQ